MFRQTKTHQGYGGTQCVATVIMTVRSPNGATVLYQGGMPMVNNS